MKTIPEKKWKSRRDLKRAVCAFVKRNPGADDLDVADHARIGLPLACEVLRELRTEGKIRRSESE